MADKIDISAIARVVDQATGPLRKITGGINTAGKAAQTTGGAFFKLNAFKFGGVTAGIRGVGQSLGGLFSQVTRLLGPLTAMAGIAGFGGAVAGFKSYIDTADKLAKTARRFGTTAEYLQQFNYVAERSGVSAETAQDALGKFMKTLGTASKGGKAAKDLIPLLSKMGISMQEIKAGDLASILPKVAAGFAKNVNPVLRNDVALKLFGKSGGKLIDMFAQGKISMEELMKEAVRLGIITNQDAAEAEKAADAWLDFTKSITGVKNSIFGALLPAVEPVLKVMKEWVLTNKEIIKEEVTKFLTKLGEIIKSIDWGRLYRGAKQFVKGMDWIAQKAGGWENILTALVIYMNRNLVIAIVNVVKHLTLLGLAMAAQIASAAGFTAAGAAIQAFSAALAATPVGLIIAVAAAVGFLAYSMWQAREDIAKAWTEIGDNTVKGAKLVAANVADAADDLPESWGDAWDRITSTAGTIWNDLSMSAKSGMALVTSNIADAGRLIGEDLSAAWGTVKTAWGTVGTWFGEKWTEAKASFDQVSTWLPGWIASFIPQPIKDAWGDLKAWFDNLLSGVVGVFQWAWGILEPIIGAIGKGVGVITGALSTAGGWVGGAAKGVAGLFGGGGGEAAPAAAPADGGSLLQSAKRAGVAGGQPTAKVEGEVQTNIKIETVGDIKATATTRDRGMASSSVEVGRSMPGLAAG